MPHKLMSLRPVDIFDTGIQCRPIIWDGPCILASDRLPVRKPKVSLQETQII